MHKAPRTIAGFLIAVFTLLLAGDVGAATICVVRQGASMGSTCMKSGKAGCNCTSMRMAGQKSTHKRFSARGNDCPFRKLLYKPASSSIQTTVQHQDVVAPAPVAVTVLVLYDAVASSHAVTQASIPPDLVILHRNLRI